MVQPLPPPEPCPLPDWKSPLPARFERLSFPPSSPPTPPTPPISSMKYPNDRPFPGLKKPRIQGPCFQREDRCSQLSYGDSYCDEPRIDVRRVVLGGALLSTGAIFLGREITRIFQERYPIDNRAVAKRNVQVFWRGARIAAGLASLATGAFVLKSGFDR